MNRGSIPYEDYDLDQVKPWRPLVTGPGNFSQLLLGGLCNLLADTFKDYVLPTPSGAEDRTVKPPMVFLHGMPDDGGEDLYPFLLVRWIEREMHSEPDHKTVGTDDVAVIVGVHAPMNQEQAGWLMADVMDIACYAILRQRIIADRFQIVEPLKASMPSELQKGHLFHLASITTRWDWIWPPKGLPEMTRLGVETGVLL